MFSRLIWSEYRNSWLNVLWKVTAASNSQRREIRIWQPYISEESWPRPVENYFPPKFSAPFTPVFYSTQFTNTLSCHLHLYIACAVQLAALNTLIITNSLKYRTWNRAPKLNSTYSVTFPSTTTSGVDISVSNNVWAWAPIRHQFQSQSFNKWCGVGTEISRRHARVRHVTRVCCAELEFPVAWRQDAEPITSPLFWGIGTHYPVLQHNLWDKICWFR